MRTDLNTRRLCRNCLRAGDQHRCSDGKCPPDREVKFPTSHYKDLDKALDRYWKKGPNSTYVPVT